MTDSESPREVDIPFGAAAVRAISKLSDQLLANLPGTLSGEDIEALHDMRVASRRIRAALRVFHEVFPKKTLRRAEAEVKSITTALGGVRDLDVFIEFLQHSTETGNIRTEAVLHSEMAERESARIRMKESLGDTFDSGFHDRLSVLLSKAYLTELSDPPCRATSFAGQAHRIVSPRVANVLALSPAVDNPLDSVGLHGLRIAMKKLRYTVEPFAVLWGSPLAVKIATVKALQEYLGQIHDCDVWTDHLKLYAADASFASEHDAVLRLLDCLAESRQSSYLSLHDLWTAAVGDGFFDGLLSTLGGVPGDHSSLQEVSTMEEEKTTQETPSEGTASDTPQAKPVARRRSPARRTAPKSEHDSPVAKSPEAETSISDAPETAAVPESMPRHPGIVDLKTLIDTASAKLSEADKLTPKLSKQLRKLDASLDKAHNRLRYVRLKQAARAEKHLLDMRQSLSLLIDGDTSPKQIDTIRKRLRSLRHKLSDIRKR